MSPGHLPTALLFLYCRLEVCGVFTGLKLQGKRILSFGPWFCYSRKFCLISSSSASRSIHHLPASFPPFFFFLPSFLLPFSPSFLLLPLPLFLPPKNYLRSRMVWDPAFPSPPTSTELLSLCSFLHFRNHRFCMSWHTTWYWRQTDPASSNIPFSSSTWKPELNEENWPSPP